MASGAADARGARVGPPYLLPLAVQAVPAVPYVVAVVDRFGAYLSGGLGQVAAEAGDLRALGQEPAARRRADEALPAAAAVTGAALMVPGGHVEVTEGVGALLRY